MHRVGKPQKSRPRGRPPCSRMMWDHVSLQRRLVRLYLYTNLDTEIISKVLSHLANRKMGLKVASSSRRSTQNELRRLFGDGYRCLRPKSRAVAKDRMSHLRQVRRPSGGACAGSGFQPRHSPSTPEDKHDRILPHDEGHPGSDSGSIRPHREIPSNKPSSTKEHIRLSWLMDAANRSGTPTSSILELRSLLSRPSNRTSTLSTSSGAGSTLQKKPFQLPSRPSPDEKIEAHNRLIMATCCKDRSSCLHRKILQLVKTPAHELQNEDFTYVCWGRDVVNDTGLHIAIRWGASLGVLIHMISRAPPDLLNIRNSYGETILHALPLEWFTTKTSDLAQLLKYLSTTTFDFAATSDIFPASWSEASTVDTCWMIMRFAENAEHVLEVTSSDPTKYQLIHQQAIKYLDKCAARLDPGFEASEAVFAGVIADQYRYVTADKAPEEYTSLISKFHSLAGSVTCSLDDLIKVMPLKSEHLNEYSAGTGLTSPMAIVLRVSRGLMTEVEALEALRIMIGRNADLDLVDFNGNTVLHHAAICGLSEITQLLLDVGANTNARNLRGETPLMGVYGSKMSYAAVQKTAVRLFDAVRKQMLRLRSPSDLVDIPE